jgi:phage host-nuclease inhibitor protein Gam
MSKKTKSKVEKLRVNVPAIETTDGLGAAVNDLVERQTKLARRRAKLDEEIAKLNTQFDEETKFDVAFSEALFGEIHVYCETHRDVFGAAKSLKIRNAVFGFRTAPPKCEKAVAKDTWEAICRRLDASEWGCLFVVTPPKVVSKEMLLSERANLDPAQLAAVGIKIVQDENFFVEPSNDSAGALVAAA